MTFIKNLLTTELHRLDNLEDGSNNRSDCLNQMRAAIMATLDYQPTPEEEAELNEEIVGLIKDVRKRTKYLREHPDFKGDNLQLRQAMATLKP